MQSASGWSVRQTSLGSGCATLVEEPGWRAGREGEHGGPGVPTASTLIGLWSPSHAQTLESESMAEGIISRFSNLIYFPQQFSSQIMAY